VALKIVIWKEFSCSREKARRLYSEMMYRPIIYKELSNTVGGSVCIVVKA
jgi:hypothetical protein